MSREGLIHEENWHRFPEKLGEKIPGAAWDSGKSWDWSWMSFKELKELGIQNFPVQWDHPLDCDGGFGIIRAGFDPGYVGVVSVDISS